MDRHTTTYKDGTIHKTLASLVARRPGLGRILIYIVLIGSIWLGIGYLPDAYFGTTLTLAIGLAASASIYVLWPQRFNLIAAPVFIAGLIAVLEFANAEKASITAFPITTIDLQMLVANPSGLLMSIGAPGWSYFAIYLVPILLVGILLWRSAPALRRNFRPRSILGYVTRFAANLVVVGISLFFINLAVVGSVTSYLNSNMKDLPIWEPEGLVDFSQKIGVLGFLSYSHYIEAAERNNFLTYAPPEPPPGNEDMDVSVAKYIKTDALKPGLSPNIIIVHAESTFDPNDVLTLDTPAQNPLFFTTPLPKPDPMMHARGPALVNVIGGGSWVTEFEVITGIDSRLFGVSGRFTHASLSRYSKRTFPRYLKEKGYVISAYTNSAGSFYNYENGYRNYGFDYFFDRQVVEPYSNDILIMKSAVTLKAGDSDAPFLKYVLLAENHSPYWCDRDPPVVYQDVRLVGQPSQDQACALKEYVYRAGNTAQAVADARSFLESEKARTGRDFVIAVYGDHQPYSFTGGGSVEHNMGLNFDEFRIDKSKRRTLFQIISSKPNPLTLNPDDALPMTMLPTLVSSYVAGSASELYLPIAAYQFDRCGSDWIGRLIGTSFYGRGSGSDEIRCSRFNEILAAYQESGVMGLPNAQDARNAESVLTEQMQTAFAQACLDPSGRLPITIVGSGTRFGDAPKFQVLMDEVLVGQGDVANAPDNTRQAVAYEQIDRASEVFQFEAMVSSVPATLAVQFMNDAWAGPDTTGDTDFWIKSVQVGDRVFPSEIFQFKSTEFMRGEWVGDWFRFATNGKLSIDIAGNLCG